MNQGLMMMVALGGRIDREALRAMIAQGNEKRRRLFVKLAELIFGLVMFFWGDLDIKVDKGGVAIDATTNDKGLTVEDKLNAMIAGLKTSHKGTLFRELVKPLLISAAEILADLLAPDEMVVAMLGGGVPGMPGSSLVPLASPAALGGYASPAAGGYASIPSGGQAGGLTPAQRYEGQNINTDGRPQVWRVQGGVRRWIAGPDVFNRLGYDWNKIIKLPAAEVDSIPEGQPLT